MTGPSFLMIERLRLFDRLRYESWMELKSKCILFRLKHQFRGMQTHGAPHADDKCFHCGKTLRQIRKERLEAQKTV